MKKKDLSFTVASKITCNKARLRLFIFIIVRFNKKRLVEMAESIFYLFSGLILLSASIVITVKNPVYSVLALIFAFFNASAIFIMLGAEYIAMTLVIVYVGAVAVLFLFVVMMLDVDFAKMRNHLVKHSWLALFMAILIFAELYLVIFGSCGFVPMPTQFFSGEVTNTEAIGKLLFTNYLIAFQVSGAILLVSMIGAIVLTIRHAKKVKRQDISKQVSRNRQESVVLTKVQIGGGVKLP